MTAILRHCRSLRRADEVVVTVYPNDGRTFTDEYRLTRAEACRFAWALLADLCPAEAKAAAAEDGLDLAAIAATARERARGDSQRRADRPAARREFPADSPPAVLLLRLAPRGQAGATLAEITVGLTLPRDGHDALKRLTRIGLAERADDAGRGGNRRARYRVTDAGRAEAARLARDLPEAA